MSEQQQHGLHHSVQVERWFRVASHFRQRVAGDRYLSRLPARPSRRQGRFLLGNVDEQLSLGFGEVRVQLSHARLQRLRVLLQVLLVFLKMIRFAMSS